MKTLIIGAGPAGLMSGIISARCGDEATIIDSNKKAGKKIRRADMELFLSYVGDDAVTAECEMEKLICYTGERGS